MALEKQKAEARKKGLVTAAAGAGTVALFFVTPWLGVPAALGTAYLGYDWFRHRAKWGLRF